MHKSVKGQHSELEKELGQLLKADDANVILLYFRRCLEVIVTDLCEKELNRPRKTEPLKGIIDKLNKEEKVPSHIITSMHHLNSLSAYGTHPKEFDPEQVKPVLNNLATIIRWYLKYNPSAGKPEVEESKSESAGPAITAAGQKNPKKRLIITITGLLLISIIIVVALAVFNVIGGGDKAGNLTEIERSIAVLPFENLSSDEQQAWFSDGITDVIINQLSKISDLRVLSRTSTLKYKEEKKLIPEIGEELGVNFILEGTVQRDGDQIRIVMQLLRAVNEDHLWSGLYDREYRDLFTIQSEIAQAVASELEAIITPLEKQLIDKVPTSDMTAFDYHLQARDHYYQYIFTCNSSYLDTVVMLAHKSLILDPEFALGYYWLGNSSLDDQWLSTYYKPFYLDSALFYFNKALELDSNLVEAYSGRGTYFHERAQTEEAVADLKRAIQLEPNHALAYRRLGIVYYHLRDYLNALSNYKEAEILERGDTDLGLIIMNIWWIYVSIDDLEKAQLYLHDKLTIDQAFSINRWILEIQGKYEEMLALADTAISLQPEEKGSYYIKSEALLGLGRIAEAEESIRIVLESSALEYMNVSHRIGLILWANGKKDEAMEYFNKQISFCKESISKKDQYGITNATYDLAGIYAVLGNSAEAMHWLREYEKLGFTNGAHEWIKVDPMFNNLRIDEEFKQIVKRANEEKAEIRTKIRQMEKEGML